jgi:transcriptional regulator with XRE-family HTH domain
MSRQATRHVVVRRGFALRFHEALGSETSEAFARRIDRTLRTVQRWRNGGSEPNGADLVLIARALDRDPSWFFSDDSDLLPAA